MSFRILNLLILLGFVTHHVTSQMPMTCTRMAYATDNRKTLYIHGGNCGGFGTNQLFSLDLSRQSLTKSMPSWKELIPAQGSAIPPAAEAHSMTISQDSRTLTLWVENLTYSFNLMTMTWTGPQILSKNATNFPALRAIKDFRSGDVYVPEGYNEGTQMAIYRSNGSFSWAPMPTAAVMSLESWLYSAVWSTLRSTMLLYGGNNFASDQGNQFLVEYNPRTNAWSRIPTGGISPGDIYNHCMVPAYNGTKMVVFGGQHNKIVGSLGSIYILDLDSMSWIKGPDVDRSLWRSNMACTVAGDNFVAWGGDNDGNIPDTFIMPIIYNLKAGQWTRDFTNTPDEDMIVLPSLVLFITATAFLIYILNKRVSPLRCYGTAVKDGVDEESLLPIQVSALKMVTLYNNIARPSTRPPGVSPLQSVYIPETSTKMKYSSCSKECVLPSASLLGPQSLTPMAHDPQYSSPVAPGPQLQYLTEFSFQLPLPTAHGPQSLPSRVMCHPLDYIQTASPNNRISHPSRNPQYRGSLAYYTDQS